MKEFTFDSYFDKDHLNKEALALFAEAMILNKQEALPEVVREHVEDCLQCKKEIFALYDLMKKDNVFKNIHKHPYFDNPIIHKRKSKVYSLLKIAATFLIIIGISSLMYFVFVREKKINTTCNKLVHNNDSLGKQRNDSVSQRSKETDLIPRKESKFHKNDTLALNMHESSLFEGLIASNYRGNELEVSFPPIGHPFSTEEVIEFKTNGNSSEPIVLIIYNNKGEKIFKKNNISAHNFTLTKKLPIGLYYWKILEGDDLVQVGKFIVK